MTPDQSYILLIRPADYCHESLALRTNISGRVLDLSPLEPMSKGAVSVLQSILSKLETGERVCIFYFQICGGGQIF